MLNIGVIHFKIHICEFVESRAKENNIKQKHKCTHTTTFYEK